MMEQARSYGRFAELYDRLMRDVDYDAWARYLATLLQRRLPGVAAPDIAECACGTGELTRRLAPLAGRYVAADLSEDMLRVAQDKARRAGLRVPFVRQDMRALETHRPVDAVVCALDGVNYLDSPEALAAFFQAANKALKEGGTLLFDVSSAYKLENTLGGHTFFTEEGDVSYVWENAFDPASRLLEMRLHFFVKRGALYERFNERHVQRAHTHDELVAALTKAGFTDISAYEAFTFHPPRAGGSRVQYAAGKKFEG